MATAPRDPEPETQSPAEQVLGGVVLGFITFAILYFALNTKLSASIGIGSLWIIAFTVDAFRGE